MCQDEARTVLKVPEVNGCCFFFSVRTGVKIIAYLHIFLIGGFLSMAFCWHIYDSYNAHITRKETTIDGLYEEEYHVRTYYAGPYTEDFAIFEILATIVFAIFLLHGINKEDSVFFEPWLILKITSVSLALFNIALLAVLRLTGHKTLKIFWELLSFTLNSYLLIVVHSLYKQYKSNYN